MFKKSQTNRRAKEEKRQFDMFQIPVQNLDNIRRSRKKVKGILVDIGLDSCQELLQTLKSFDPGEKYFSSTSWNDVSHWDNFAKRKRYRTNPYCCSLCKFSSKFLNGFKNHLTRYHEDEMDQDKFFYKPSDQDFSNQFCNEFSS
ncbi:ADNP homeobox protein 2 [Crotalus adamanteus]|uniref:ADNP homeobox protein 2 n=1 Tax=Crotalus adamanteus TaxID=8729 RepID=A0AAW1BPV3_CROAD